MMKYPRPQDYYLVRIEQMLGVGITYLMLGLGTRASLRNPDLSNSFMAYLSDNRINQISLKLAKILEL